MYSCSDLDSVDKNKSHIKNVGGIGEPKWRTSIAKSQLIGKSS